MHITALDVIAPHARYKLWVKPNGEMPFLYGGNVVKAHVGKWSEDCPAHQGVVVLAMNDTPLVCLRLRLVWDWMVVTDRVHRDSESLLGAPPKLGGWNRLESHASGRRMLANIFARYVET